MFALVLLSVLALAAGCGSQQAEPPDAQAAAGIARTDNIQAVANNGQVLVAGTGAASLLVSADGGQNWKRQALAAPASIIDMAACKDGSLYGLDFYGKLWRGSADGNSWTSKPLSKGYTPLAMSCGVDGRVWVVGSHTTIASSADGGATWQSSTLKEDAMLRTVQFVDAQHGFITGEFGMVLATQDGGLSWSPAGNLPEDFYPYDAHFADAAKGWVSGLAGTVYATVDGGRTWTQQDNASGASLYVLLERAGRLFGFGDGGVIALLDGERWIGMEPSVPGAAFVATAVQAGDKGVLVGGLGGLLRTVALRLPASTQKDAR